MSKLMDKLLAELEAKGFPATAPQSSRHSPQHIPECLNCSIKNAELTGRQTWTSHDCGHEYFLPVIR